MPCPSAAPGARPARRDGSPITDHGCGRPQTHTNCPGENRHPERVGQSRTVRVSPGQSGTTATLRALPAPAGAKIPVRVVFPAAAPGNRVRLVMSEHDARRLEMELCAAARNYLDFAGESGREPFWVSITGRHKELRLRVPREVGQVVVPESKSEQVPEMTAPALPAVTAGENVMSSDRELFEYLLAHMFSPLQLRVMELLEAGPRTFPSLVAALSGEADFHGKTALRLLLAQLVRRDLIRNGAGGYEIASDRVREVLRLLRARDHV